MNRLVIKLVLAMLALVLSSCTSTTRQTRDTKILDASQEDEIGGTGTSSGDIRSMAQRMALDIAGLAWPDESGIVRIAMTAIDNQTRFPINPNIIKDRLLTDLMEFSAGTRLRFTENPSGADYFLQARITALSKGSSSGVSDYLLYSFKLLDQADTISWMKSYETKKQGTVGVMYR